MFYSKLGETEARETGFRQLVSERELILELACIQYKVTLHNIHPGLAAP